MRQIRIIPLVIGGMLLMVGCAPYWKVTEPDRTANRYYQLSAPADWMFFEQGSSMMFSKHGPSLESIIILHHDLNSPLPLTSLPVRKEMLLHELAELILNRMIAGPGVSNVVLLEESIDTVSDKRAVKVVIDYTLNETPRRDIVYAFIADTYLYELRYSAVKRHYFQESLDSFETILRNFRLKQ